MTRAWATAICALAASACGTSPADAPADGGGQNDPRVDLSTGGSSDLSGADLSGVDLSGVDLSGVDLTAADLAPGPSRGGFLTAWSQDYRYGAAATQVIKSSSLSAAFNEFPPGPPSCVPKVFGSCKVWSGCTSSTPTRRSAGTIQLTGGSQPITITPSPDGSYAGFNDTTHTLWSGGETLTFSGSGADAPAFSATLTAPSTTTITAPAVPVSGSSLAVPRSADLTVSWNSAGSGDLSVVLGSSGGPTIGCLFARGSGSNVVPAAALGLMPAGSGSFSILAQATNTITAGAWSITAEATSIAVNPGGYSVGGAVTYQ